MPRRGFAKVIVEDPDIEADVGKGRGRSKHISGETPKEFRNDLERAIPSCTAGGWRLSPVRGLAIYMNSDASGSSRSPATARLRTLRVDSITAGEHNFQADLQNPARMHRLPLLVCDRLRGFLHRRAICGGVARAGSAG